MHDYPGIEEMDTVEIVVFSEAYFMLLEADPWVLEVLTLGDRVRFVYKEVLLEIGEEGVDSAQELSTIIY